MKCGMVANSSHAVAILPASGGTAFGGGSCRLSVGFRIVLERATYIQSSILGHHTLNSNTDTLNNCKEDTAHDGAVSRCFPSASHG